jgi:hypothetical protein
MTKEQIREKIAEKLYRIAGYTEDFETTFPNKAWHNLNTETKERWYVKADQILAIDGLEIKSDDQSLPENPYLDEPNGYVYEEGQQTMLKAGFIKCLPKRRE